MGLLVTVTIHRHDTMDIKEKHEVTTLQELFDKIAFTDPSEPTYVQMVATGTGDQKEEHWISLTVDD